MTTSDDARTSSPCTSVCIIDHTSGLCIGCYRTLSEIAGWIDLTEEARRALIAALPARRASAGTTMPPPEAPHGKR
jgi:predicted Fe-S protein YdhL (DUF1289 family)